jgi:putative hydrolase
MEFVLDVHTHTLASGHAYNTMSEMACAAGKKGLQLLGITEHAVQMPGTCCSFYFENLKMVDRNKYKESFGVELLLGTELNILDYQGTIDMEERTLKKMDVTIASIHPPCYHSGTREENTQAYLETIKNPYVNIIGHPDDGRFKPDYLALVQAAKEYGVLLELNNNSLDPRCFRQNGRENMLEMLGYCKEYQAPVIIGSDAHADDLVGNHKYVEELLKEIDFPEELVVNRSVEELKKYVNKYKVQ